MGRTPKPLTLLVHESLWNTPEIQVLRDKGHHVDTLGAPETAADLLLAPNAWKMDTRLIKYLDLAVKAARAIKYPKKEKK